MTSINKVILVGHIGKKPDVCKLEGNVTVASFPLATECSIKKDGGLIEQTEWHNIVLWREIADMAAKVLDKGKLVYIEGKIQTRSFEKDGIKRYATEIIGQKFIVLNSGEIPEYLKESTDLTFTN
jgi:single-strand DNA-binding protein